MSTAASTFGAPINFRGIDWPRLTTTQYGELEDALRNRWKAQLDRFLDESKLAGEARFNALRGQWRDPNLYDVNEYVHTRDGFVRVLLSSLKKAGKTDTEAQAAVEAISPVYAKNLARALLDFDQWVDPDGTGAPLPNSQAAPQGQAG